MGVNPDFKDLFKALNDHSVEYLVVGAYAVIFYTIPRFTQDLDVLINPTPDNAHKTWLALMEFGAPLENITEKDFTDKKMVYQIGMEPNRIDIMMGISGVEFSPAWENREKSTYGGIPISIIGCKDLILSKKIVNRLQDRIDLENLKRVKT